MVNLPPPARARSSRAVTALERWLPLLAWMVLIYWLSAQPVVPHPGRAIGLHDHLVDYTAHAVLFGALTLLTWWALGDPGTPSLLLRRGRLAAALVWAVLYAASDELHQIAVPGRCATLPDWLADVAGILLAGATLWAWERRARRETPAKGTLDYV